MAQHGWLNYLYLRMHCAVRSRVADRWGLRRKCGIIIRDVNVIIENSLKMPGSRGRIGPGGVKGQRPCGGPKGATPPGRNWIFTLLQLENWPLLDRSWLRSEGKRELIRKKYKKYITYFFAGVNALYHSSTVFVDSRSRASCSWQQV